jgi:hypothetical protein
MTSGDMMVGKFLVGIGLVIMASAIAYYGMSMEAAATGSQAADRGASLAFLVFLFGVLVAIVGGISAARG